LAKIWRVVDLFAGPGGLGEGFARARRTDGSPACEVVLSVENDAAACATLRLRHALRRLDRLPRSYLDWIADPARAGDRPPLEAAAWRAAEEAVVRRELGRPGVFGELEPRLRRLRERSHGATILIGGPPCQAYSLIGRARNAGNPGYDPERDGRHFLYREYLRTLGVPRPAAFVMENVPGLLSARAGRERIFPRILEDLASIGRGADGYELLAFGTARPGSVDVRDFVVRAEEHGVPQARRRVFVIGVRRDLLPALLPGVAPRPPVAAGTVLEGMEAGLEVARPGRTCEDIANAFFAVLGRWGIVKDNRTGYSIGLSYPPDWGERTMSLRPGDRTPLEPGMTFHFMTGLWLDDWGFEMSESIVIEERGARCLARVPRELFVVE
jgi:DNA (cytosine-5)-methyltransferase 1